MNGNGVVAGDTFAGRRSFELMSLQYWISYLYLGQRAEVVVVLGILVQFSEVVPEAGFMCNSIHLVFHSSAFKGAFN